MRGVGLGGSNRARMGNLTVGFGTRENVYLGPILRRETRRSSTVGEGLRAEPQRLL
jgi:hypothetical protein